jgi:hypothetical protein
MACYRQLRAQGAEPGSLEQLLDQAFAIIGSQ